MASDVLLLRKKQSLQKRYLRALSVEAVFEKQRSRNLIASSAKGLQITDVTGKKFLDFGNSMVLLGHSHPEIVKVVTERAADLLVGGVPGWTMVEPRVLFAEELKSHMPGRLNGHGKVAYCSSGAEACDYALGLARAYTKRNMIISFSGGYHGFTGATLAVNGIEPWLAAHRTPSRDGTVTAPYPESRDGRDKEKHEAYCIEKFREMLDTVASPDEVAATIFEPVEVMAGLRIPSAAFWQQIFGICKKNGILTIADEVFTGLGKTGRFLAVDHFGVEPDVVCLGKGVGATLPLGVIVSRAEVLDDHLKPNCNSSSAGNPISCVAGLEGLKVIKREKLVKRAASLGEYFLARLREVSGRHDAVKEVRGIGLILCMELNASGNQHGEKAQKLVEMMFDEGILVARNGIHRNMIRVSPPLVVKREQIDQFVVKMNTVLSSL
ncbi:MAG: aminotransferase class III-fold pyridoxal phosphate-dependent enzyme [Thaumarchaeota archaeon]|nr:aminotransferase class III-fold pyridoxal phosphate-dependent enzyme [Nitrososphaerota archaeon]